MATTVDTLLIEVTADLKDVRRKLGQLEKDTKRTGDRSAKNMNKLSKAIKLVAGAVVVREFARAANAAVDFTSHVEEMQAKSSVVFGEFAGDVRKQLGEFGKEVGRSAFQLEEMAASVQDTFVPMGFARGEAAGLSVELAKLATDVASFNNASDTETMKAFQSALVGNHETVRRFGIVITEAELQAELFRMGITKSKAQITAAEKVQARLNLILAGTTDAHGDAARTAESYANRVKNMQAAIERLQLAIGTKLLPMFTGLVEATTLAADALAEFLNGPSASGSTIEESQKVVAGLQAELMKLADAYEYHQKVGERQTTQDQRQIGIIERKTAAIAEQMMVELDNIEALEANAKRADALEKSKKEEVKKEQGATALGEGTKFMQDQANEVDLLAAALRGATEAELALLSAQQGGAAFTPQQLANYEAMTNAIDEMSIKMQGIEEINSLIEGSAQQLSSGISQSMTDMVTGVTSGMEGMKNVVSSVISTVIQKLIELAVVNRMVNAAMSFFGAPQSAMLPTFASGGSMRGGQPAIVGERGPELIIPKSASVVKNAHDTRNIMGGGTPVVINQSLNFSTGVQATVRNEVMTMMPQIQEATKAAVAEQAQRGGSYTRAF